VKVERVVPVRDLVAEVVQAAEEEGLRFLWVDYHGRDAADVGLLGRDGLLVVRVRREER